MKKDKVQLKCELCGLSKLFESVRESDWTEVSIESLYVDRCWTEKHLCPSCVKLVLAVEAKRKEAVKK
jgi:hypothetical protein